MSHFETSAGERAQPLAEVGAGVMVLPLAEAGTKWVRLPMVLAPLSLQLLVAALRCSLQIANSSLGP